MALVGDEKKSRLRISFTLKLINNQKNLKMENVKNYGNHLKEVN
jgi:hypothetical protein